MTELVIYNAKVYIEEGLFAQAVLVRGDRIAAAGTNDEILFTAAPAAERIDARGNLLLPGFNDSHLHLYHYGRNIHRIQANGVTSIDEIVERGRKLIDRLKPAKGSVVTGTGWNQDLFTDERRLPNRHDMDRISIEHAVIISRVCGHSLCCNTLALQMAGITRNSVYAKDIELDENGKPTGLLGEGPALYKVRSLIPPDNQKQIKEYLIYAIHSAHENGITSTGSMDIFDENYQNIVDSYNEILKENDLRLRVSLQCGIEKKPVFSEFIKRGWKTRASMGHPFLTMGGAKLFADGSLGSRTAYLRKPYSDDPSSCGHRIHTQEEMDALVKKHHDNGFQVIVHAIGDAAIEETLNSFKKVTGGHRNDLRHGIVHCQITDRRLLQRMADNNILAFVQPIFLTHDLYMLEDRVGKELASTSYALGTMKKLGVKTAYGTDCPVESISPIECIDCAVNRRDVSNSLPEGGFYPGEGVDVYTAVDAYTTGGAYAEFAEDQKGRIKAGFLADMTLLDRDIFTIQSKDIKTAKVLMTVMGGKTIYMKQEYSD